MAITTANMGLTKWDSSNDYFSHAQLAANWAAVDVHDHTTGKGVKIPAGGLDALSVATANLQDASVTAAKLAALTLATGNYANLSVTNGKLAGSIAWSKMLGTAVQSQLGVNDGTTVSRGKTSISAEQSTTSTSYTTLSTADEVTSVVLPTDGLITINYQALVKSLSAGANGRVAIFIGANQLKAGGANGAPAVQEVGSIQTKYSPLWTTNAGLALQASSAASDSSEVTTGQLAGSGAMVFAAAGTYTISVKYKAALVGDPISAKNRHLWVIARSY